MRCNLLWGHDTLASLNDHHLCFTVTSLKFVFTLVFIIHLINVAALIAILVQYVLAVLHLVV